MVDPWSRNYVINVEDPLMNFRQQLCKTNFHSTYEILRDKEDRFASTNYYYVRKRSQSADDHRRFFAKVSTHTVYTIHNYSLIGKLSTNNKQNIAPGNGGIDNGFFNFLAILDKSTVYPPPPV